MNQAVGNGRPEYLATGSVAQIVRPAAPSESARPSESAGPSRVCRAPSGWRSSLTSVEETRTRAAAANAGEDGPPLRDPPGPATAPGRAARPPPELGRCAAETALAGVWAGDDRDGGGTIMGLPPAHAAAGP